MDFTNIDTCPICKSQNNKNFGKPICAQSKISKYRNTFLQYKICKNCSLIYMSPRPSQDWYNKLYKDTFWEEKAKSKNLNNNKSYIKKQLYIEALRAKKLCNYLTSVNFNKKKNPKLLEIGCSYGKIVRDLANNFFGEAWGVEPSNEAADFAQNKIGVKIYARNTDDLFNKSDKELFDLIFFSHCLENIIDPIKTLNKVFQLLKKDGLLLIDTPNNFLVFLGIYIILIAIQ